MNPKTGRSFKYLKQRKLRPADQLFHDFMGRAPDSLMLCLFASGLGLSLISEENQSFSMSTKPQVLAWLTCDSVYVDPATGSIPCWNLFPASVPKNFSGLPTNSLVTL